jgi:hypothetical protein
MSWYVHISFWNIILEHEIDNHNENYYKYENYYELKL